MSPRIVFAQNAGYCFLSFCQVLHTSSGVCSVVWCT